MPTDKKTFFQNNVTSQNPIKLRAPEIGLKSRSQKLEFDSDYN